MIDVVIPTLNEEASLPALLQELRALGTLIPLDVVVADGGSSDETCGRAAAAGVRVIEAPRGRAQQLNAGARTGGAEWLLFLHADSRLTAEAQRAVVHTVRASRAIDAAVFRFAIELPWFWKRFVQTGQRLREILWGLSYGDQGLLVRREVFEAVGGYAEIPLMEDVAIIRALRQRTVVRVLPATIVTSGRRYLRDGVVRTWMRHSLLIALYRVGVSPARLARWRNA